MEYLFSLDDFYDNIVSEGHREEGRQKSRREMEGPLRRQEKPRGKDVRPRERQMEEGHWHREVERHGREVDKRSLRKVFTKLSEYS